jgi:hypothetical protein
MTHDQFVRFLSSTVDIGMQVSLSESFCIVAADLVSLGIPIVGGSSIRWLDHRAQCNPISISAIVSTLKTVLNDYEICLSNFSLLQAEADAARKAWLIAMKDIGA